MTNFPANLKALRLHADRSQEDMARMYNVPRSTYAAWEQGRSQPSLEQLQAIQQHLQIGLDVLIGSTLYAYDAEEIDRIRIAMAPRPRRSGPST